MLKFFTTLAFNYKIINIMRDRIMVSLLKAKKTHQELIEKYSLVLPKHLMDGVNNTVEVEIPKHANNFISVLNMVLKENAFKEILTLDDAIEIFSEENISEAINQARESLEIGAVRNKGKFSAKEILEASEYGINSGTQLLLMYKSAGDLTNNF